MNISNPSQARGLNELLLIRVTFLETKTILWSINSGAAILKLTSQTQTSVYLSTWPRPILFPCSLKPSLQEVYHGANDSLLCCYLMRAMHVPQQKMLRQGTLQCLKQRKWDLPTKQSDYFAYERTVRHQPLFTHTVKQLIWVKCTSIRVSHLKLGGEKWEFRIHW